MVVIRQKGVNVCCFRIRRTITIVAFLKPRCAKILAVMNILSTSVSKIGFGVRNVIQAKFQSDAAKGVVNVFAGQPHSRFKRSRKSCNDSPLTY